MRNLEEYNISSVILEACKRLGITTLAEFLLAPESAFQEILVPAQMAELYNLVNSYNLRWGSQEGRDRAYEIAYQQDRALCSALTYSILEMSLRDWETAEAEYAIHPEMFEDLTQYDSEGRPFFDNGILYCTITDRSYRTFLEQMDIDDEALALIDPNIMVLLECKKFVRKKDYLQ